MTLHKLIGRPPGSMNRKSLNALRILSDRKFKPVEFLAAIAQSDHEYLRVAANVITLEQRIAAAKALMPYVCPQLKSIEIEQINPAPITVKIINFGDLMHSKTEWTEPSIDADSVDAIDAATGDEDAGDTGPDERPTASQALSLASVG